MLEGKWNSSKCLSVHHHHHHHNNNNNIIIIIIIIIMESFAYIWRR
jgi:hypothetical protein